MKGVLDISVYIKNLIILSIKTKKYLEIDELN